MELWENDAFGGLRKLIEALIESNYVAHYVKSTSVEIFRILRSKGEKLVPILDRRIWQHFAGGVASLATVLKDRVACSSFGKT